MKKGFETLPDSTKSFFNGRKVVVMGEMEKLKNIALSDIILATQMEQWETRFGLSYTTILSTYQTKQENHWTWDGNNNGLTNSPLGTR